MKKLIFNISPKSILLKIAKYWRAIFITFALLSLVTVKFILPSNANRAEREIKNIETIIKLSNSQKFNSALLAINKFKKHFPDSKYQPQLEYLAGLNLHSLAKLDAKKQLIQNTNALRHLEKAFLSKFHKETIYKLAIKIIQNIAKNGDYSIAISELEKLQTYFPEKSDISTYIALYLSKTSPPKQEDALKAIDNYLTLVQLPHKKYNGLLIKGKIYNNLALFDNAAEAFISASQVKGIVLEDHKHALLLAGRAFLSNKEYQKSIDILKNEINLSKTADVFPDITYHLALSYFFNNQEELAISYLNPLLHIKGDLKFKSLVHKLLGDIYFSIPQYEKALTEYTTSLKILSSSKNLNTNFYKFPEVMKKIDKIFDTSTDISLLTKGLDTSILISQINPNNTDIHNFLATKYTMLGRVINRKALNEYALNNELSFTRLDKRAKKYIIQGGIEYIASITSQENSKYFPANFLLAGKNFFQTKQYAPAIAAIENYILNASTSTPEAVEAYYMLGISYKFLGQYDLALVNFDQIIRLAPQHSYNAQIEKANVLLKKKEYISASIIIETLLKSDLINPQSQIWKDALYQLGLIYFQAAQKENENNNIDSARSNFRKASAIFNEIYERYSSNELNSPLVIKALYKAGNTYMNLQEWPNAISSLQKAKNLYNIAKEFRFSPEEQSDLPQILKNINILLADAYFNLEDYKTALNLYKRIAKRYNKKPDVLWAHSQIIKCYRKLNNPSLVKDAQDTMNLAIMRLEKGVINKLIDPKELAFWKAFTNVNFVGNE